MTSRVAREHPPSARVRRAMERQAAHRRRTGALVAGAVVVALVAAVVGLRFAGGSHPSTPAAKTGAAPAPGELAPNATFTTLSGRTETVASLRGHPTLLWLMTTWCSSCQASTQTLAQNLPALEADGVRVVEVENYEDLGESGPTLAEFAKVLAGSERSSPEWTFGEASLGLTETYNPASDLDVYYLLDAAGRVVYVNSTPAATMSEILAHAAKLS